MTLMHMATCRECGWTSKDHWTLRSAVRAVAKHAAKTGHRA